MNKCAITNKECKHASDDSVPLHKRCEHARKPDDCPIMIGITTDPERKTCKECKCWDLNKNESIIGWCRRYPPSFYIIVEYDGDDEVWGYRNPETYDDEWCGEFQPKNPTEAQEIRENRK